MNASHIPVHVLLVDDHAIRQAARSQFLEQVFDIQVSGEANEGEATVQHNAQHGQGVSDCTAQGQLTYLFNKLQSCSCSEVVKRAVSIGRKSQSICNLDSA